MKKIILSAFLAMASISAMAQGPRREFNPEQNATRQANRIKETCKVDDAQYEKLYKLFLEEANQQKARMDSLRAAGVQGPQRGNMDREAWQKRREEQAAKIKAILTAEQYAAYEEAQKQMMERRRQGGFGGGFGGGQQQ